MKTLNAEPGTLNLINPEPDQGRIMEILIIITILFYMLSTAAYIAFLFLQKDYAQRIGYYLILAGFAPVTAVLSGWAPVWLVDLVSGTSVLSHFASIARGVVDLRDLFYYFSVMAFMIVLNGVILQNRESA